MTYLQILRLLESYAWNQPDVHSVVREFTDLNRETAQYAAVVIQDRDGERDLISGQDWITYTWHIGYVDRLWDEKMTTSSGERTEKLGSENILTNRDDIYSQGIRVINNIIAGLRKDYDLDITTPDRINTFNQRFTAECAGVYMVIAVTVPVSDCEDSGVESMYDSLNQRFTANGAYHFVPEGKPWNEADIVIDVHPEDPLIVSFTNNGNYYFEGEWKDAHIDVFVHPSTSLSETYTENGTYNIDGEFNGGQVTVAVPQKEEESLVETITSNGSYSYSPQAGYVYDGVSLSVDVHPSTSLTRNYTTNGQKTITGEFNGGTININVHPSTSLSETYTENGTYSIDGEFNGGQVTVAVSGGGQKPEESLVETITSNGSYSYSPQPGYVYDGVSLSVDVHPSTSLSRTYTSNGTYSISGEFNGGEVTVAVSGGGGEKPEESLIVNITNNGIYNYAPQAGYVFSSAEVNVSVPTTNVVTVTQSAYDDLSVKDPDTIYLIYN